MQDRRSVEELAYQLWEARGRPAGSSEEDWLNAERSLASGELDASRPRQTAPVLTKAVDDSLRDTFPASDPPASHLPDEPPTNADKKWEAAGISRDPPTNSNSGAPTAAPETSQGNKPKRTARMADAAEGAAPAPRGATGRNQKSV